MQASFFTFLLSACLLLFGAGCQKFSPPSIPIRGVGVLLVDFGDSVSAILKVQDIVRYNDGFQVSLKAINDSRCKPDVQCIWQGQLSPVFSVSGGELKEEREITLGTVLATTTKIQAYTIKLKDATTDSATITVTKDAGQATSTNDLISITSPTSGQIVKSPLTVTGQARGTWYFEASFPVKLADANGKVLATAPAQAQGDWMTTDFVPFSVNLSFATPTTATGTLILEKDNPSDLPELDDSRSLPVKFR